MADGARAFSGTVAIKTAQFNFMEQQPTPATIFIIDDDEFLLDMYVLKFKESGYHVEIAKNGGEALEKIRNGMDANVVMLDIVMPHMDGFELLQTIQKEKLLPDALFILLTNLGQKEDIDHGLRLGVADYIIKAHFTPTEVVRRVEALLEKHKLKIKN